MATMEAGREFGIVDFGYRALDSMRLEKSYRMVGTELSIEYSAYESAMDRFIKPDKGDFLGREALERVKAEGVTRRFKSLPMNQGAVIAGRTVADAARVVRARGLDAFGFGGAYLAYIAGDWLADELKYFNERATELAPLPRPDLGCLGRVVDQRCTERRVGLPHDARLDIIRCRDAAGSPDRRRSAAERESGKARPRRRDGQGRPNAPAPPAGCR